jgi:hypothetical protein
MLQCTDGIITKCVTVLNKNPHTMNSSFDSGNNRVWVDWVDHNVVRLRVKGTASLPANLESFACSADAEILINVENQTAIREGDTFPSVGVYWYPETGTKQLPAKTLLQSKETNLKGLCGNPTYSTPRSPLSATRP